MTKNWYMLQKKYRPVIEVISVGGFLTAGEQYSLTMETDNEIYVIDDFGREVYMFKKDEGKDFKYIKYVDDFYND